MTRILWFCVRVTGNLAIVLGGVVCGLWRRGCSRGLSAVVGLIETERKAA